MKKNFKRLWIVVLTMVCMAVALTACSGGNENKSGKEEKKSVSPFIGEWTTVVVQMDGQTAGWYPEEDGEVRINVKDGGELEFVIDGESESCKWKEENDKLIVEIEGEEVTAELGEKKNTIIFKNWYNGGVDFIMGKVGTDAADVNNYELDIPLE